MKNIKISKVLLFVVLGNIIPLFLVYITKSNRLSFPGSNIILGLALAMLIIILALIVANNFVKMTKNEKICNVIVGLVLYTIIFILFIFLLLKPVEYKVFDLIVTGYYGSFATVLAIYTRSDDSSKDLKKK